MSWLGDFPLGATFDTKFCTVQSTGAPTTLSASPVVSNYVGNGTTELTAGITLSVDFDSRTGLNNVRVVATVANGYAQATDNQLVITTGTVNSVSAVGYVVAEYSIQNRSNSLIGAGVGAFPAAGIVDAGTLQSATGTTAVIRSAAAFANSELVGHTISITGGTGAGQSRLITASVGSSDTVTVDTWTTTPDNTSTYVIYPTPPGSTSSPGPVNTVQFAGQTITAAAGVTLPASVASPTNITAATGCVLSTAGATAAADALLARNQLGGATSSPTVSAALAGGLMLIDITAGVLTVKNGDGTTAFTRTLTRSALNAIITAV